MLGILTLNSATKVALRVGRLVWEKGWERRQTMQETALSLSRTERFLSEHGATRSTPAILELVEQVAKLRSRWDRFVEDYVRHGCEPLFAERGIHFDCMQQRVRVYQGDGNAVCVDIVAVSGNLVILMEVESTLKVADVERLMGSLRRFRELFPMYADCQVVGAVAGVLTEEAADDYARAQGMFVILHAGDRVWLANDREFEPRHW
ncbi:MAG: hypothetical protein HQL66_14690 [Magnetococcales bacterium]|nr:hypothetical protein [Magnetococcales bacterium]